MNEIKCEVTKSVNVFIKTKDANANLDTPLYAINWFSAKFAWLYHLYNFLANKSLTKIGGKGFFKGEITKTILDENKSRRDLILIVRYPNGNSFKALMEDTYFKIVSLLRMAAVKDFSFGFTQKQTKSTSTLGEELKYVVHHFKTTNQADYPDFDKFLTDEVTIKYSGKMIAALITKQKNKPAEKVPNIMDGIVIYESKSEEIILNMIAKNEYQKIVKSLDSSFIGTVKRVL